MAFRITNLDDTVQQIRGLPISATTGAAIRCDSTAATQDVTFAVWCYFDSDPGVDADYGIFKTYTSPNTNHLSLNLKRSASGATWQLGGCWKGNSIGFPYTFPSSPIGKWYLVAFTQRARAATANDYTYLTIYDPQAVTTTVGYSSLSTAAGTVPDLASIGNFRTTGDTGTQRNALGIFIPAILVGSYIVDGTVQDSVNTIPLSVLATNKGLEGHIAFGTETQTVTITGTPTGGTFTLTFEGQTTGAIAYNASAATVQTALVALSNIGPGDVICTGGALPGTAVVVEFTGALAGANRTLMTATSSLTGGSSPAIAVTRSRSSFAFSSCVWAANFSASAYNSANEDARVGKAALSGGDATGNIAVFDSSGSVFVNSHQQPRGGTVVGTISSVNPYAYGTISYPVPTDTSVGSSADPATSLTLAASGVRDRNLTKLANWINDGTGTGQLRVGIFGNSRAVYPSQYPLRLSDGTYPGRTMATNFADMGIMGQAGLWNNGRIIGGLWPVPTCQWSGTNQLEGAYGHDCSAALLRTKDSGGTVVNPSTVLTSLVNSTLGSRLGLTSRTPTTVPSSAGSADNYRGCGCAVRLSPGCTYRVMIRPEAGYPVTDPLTVKLHVINYPASSEISAAKKVVAAGQLDAEDSSSAVSKPGLGPASGSVPPTAKAITAVSAATLTNQVTHSAYGYIVVDDADLGFSGGLAPIGVGDLMQLQDSGGATSTYNEAWIVRSVTGAGTDTCTISYEWLPRQAPIVGDKVTYTKSGEILQTVTATFAAGEVASSKWRGIEITADEAGDGVLLWGLEVLNPTRHGVFVVPIGRSGCGAWIQAARWPRIDGDDAMNLTDRIFSAFDLDVMVLTTADQGTAGGYYVSSYDTLIDYVQAATPTTSIVLYSTGPEYQDINVANKQDYGDKYDYAACLQYAADSADLPSCGYLFSRYTSAFGRLMAGDDCTESPTHPACVLDVTFLGAQLEGLRAEATSISHGMYGRRRSALRHRG